MASGGNQFIDEIDFLFSTTHNFSTSFGIKHERIRNWRMLGIVANREEGGRIKAGTLRRAIKPLIPRGRSTDSLHSWVNKFVGEFRNDTGLFLDRISDPAIGRTVGLHSAKVRKRAPNTTHYALNANFNTCAKSYVSGLLSHAEFIQKSAPQLTDDIVRQVVRTLFKFQNNEYWKLWLQLLKDMSEVAKSKGYGTDINVDKLRIIHWIVMTIVWRSSLADQTKNLDSIDLNSEAMKILIVVDPEELSKVIHFWTSERGGKVLLEHKKDKTERYSFNPEYAGALRSYITAAILVRPQWRAEFVRALQPQSARGDK